MGNCQSSIGHSHLGSASDDGVFIHITRHVGVGHQVVVAVAQAVHEACTQHCISTRDRVAYGDGCNLTHGCSVSHRHSASCIYSFQGCSSRQIGRSVFEVVVQRGGELAEGRGLSNACIIRCCNACYCVCSCLHQQRQVSRFASNATVECDVA